MSVKVDVWMPTYYMELEAATKRLSDAEFRVYWRLIVDYWHTGQPLPDKDSVLAAIANKSLAEWRRMRPVLMAYFVPTDGVWRHKRVDKELAAARANKTFAVGRAQAGAKARWKDHKPKAQKPPKTDASSIIPSNASSNARNLNPPNGELIESSPVRGRNAPRSPNEGRAAITPEEREEVGRQMRAWADQAKREGKITPLFPDGPPAKATGR